MASRHWFRIEKISKDIDRRKTIPLMHQATLEQRLVIACKPLPRQPRGKVPRSRQEIQAYHTRKKAQSVYLEILNDAPHLFLPFILTTPPKSCERFNSWEFCQSHKQEHQIRLSNDVKTILEDLADKNEFSESLFYKRVVEQLFLKVSPKPITTAESDVHWAYHAADINRIRTIFGDHISDAVESAPMRLREKAKTQTLQVTECVRTSFPRHNFQDAIISLDVGPAHEVARILFPQTSHFTSSLLNAHEDGVQTQTMSEQQGGPSEQEDHAYFTLKGASISAIRSIFNLWVRDAIEKSQLRVWEKEHQLLDTTDCVTMEIRRKEPQHGTIRLRIEFLDGIRIVKDLYTEPTSVNSIIQASTSL